MPRRAQSPLDPPSRARAERLARAVALRGTKHAFHVAMHRRAVAGSGRPAIDRYLAARAEPVGSFWEAAADVLGVRLAWLMSGEEPMTGDVTPFVEPPDFPELQLGSDAARRRRVEALSRFTRKLEDAGRFAPDAPWRDLDARTDLLRAAASFLVAADVAVDQAGHDGRMYRDYLIHRVSPSTADYVDWSDAVLDLFSRRVVGLGARPHRVVELTTIERERRRERRDRHACRRARAGRQAGR